MTNQDILLHAAPTLANIKMANLFSVKYEDKAMLQQIISDKNQLFAEKGLVLQVLKFREKDALLYVYRKKKLSMLLEQADIQGFLGGYGYESFDVTSSLAILETHLEEGDFPHEIGVFLGYPLADVVSFIQEKGKNCPYTGCWKAYHDLEQAKKMFHLYQKCVRIYLERYAKGTELGFLTVAS